MDKTDQIKITNITNRGQLLLTREALANAEDALIALKDRIYYKYPELFERMSQDLCKTIQIMRSDIEDYIGVYILPEEIKSFIDLVENLRDTQREYFRTRGQVPLVISKQLELQVDQKILALKKRRK